MFSISPRVFGWIEERLNPRPCHSGEFMYDEMESQSDRCLPLIYRPFDPGDRAHWRDRGALFDFLFSTEGSGRKLLDFGPGDGWPSLIVAPHAGEVIGIEGSMRRADVCRENAARMGISNARFLHLEPGTAFPFDDSSFDGVMASSSVEQSPDPRATLGEFFRILRPGGRLRIFYEGLARYRNGKEREAFLDEIDPRRCRLILYDRHIEEEYATMYRIDLSISSTEAEKKLDLSNRSASSGEIGIPRLECLSASITETRICNLRHPSGKTLASWLEETGFREMIPSHGGADFAGRLFDEFSGETLPADMETVDTILRPLVRIVVRMKAPLDTDPMITAIRY